jgi:hypothetical protein
MKRLARNVGVKLVFALAALVALSSTAPRARAQEPSQKKPTQLKVQVIFSEFDGEKKVGSLPYVFYVMADAPRDERASVRMGLRVPVRTGGSAQSANNQYSYQDIGTNLDCTAHVQPDGSYALVLTIQRSSLYSTGSEVARESQLTGASAIVDQPVIQNFSTNIQIAVKDGQTVQSNLTADPISGHILKVDVTLTVVK